MPMKAWKRNDPILSTDLNGNFNYVLGLIAPLQTGLQPPGALSAAWDLGAVVTAGTVVLTRKMPFPGTINSMDYELGTGGGSFTVTAQIDGVPITGLTGIQVLSSTSANQPATAANVFAIGSKITFTISAVSGTPTASNLQLNFTR